MKVIWSYSVRPGNLICDLEKSTIQLFFAIASAVSWKKFEPDVPRIFYVDQHVYDFFRSKNLLGLYSEVHVIDFEKDLWKKYGVDFFAYPKIWACLHQDEPFVISDTDVLITKPVNSWIKNPRKAYGPLYSFPYPGLEPTKESDIERLNFEVQQLDSSIQSLVNLENCVNGGLIYYPDPDKARIMALTLLSVSRTLQKSKFTSENIPGGWLLEEEATIPTICEKIGMRIHQSLDESDSLGAWIHTAEENFSPDLRERVRWLLSDSDFLAEELAPYRKFAPKHLLI